MQGRKLKLAARRKALPMLRASESNHYFSNPEIDSVQYYIDARQRLKKALMKIDYALKEQNAKANHIAKFKDCKERIYRLLRKMDKTLGRITNEVE